VDFGVVFTRFNGECGLFLMSELPRTAYGAIASVGGVLWQLIRSVRLKELLVHPWALRWLRVRELNSSRRY
jgi:hypothetical protein